MFIGATTESREYWLSWILRLYGTFGAILTILALGISTFTQQTLKYDMIYPSTLDARMPIAQVVDISTIDSQLASSPYVALFSPPHTKFTATASCSSGNCTWDSYHTLGVCNTCQDLSSRLGRTGTQFNHSSTNTNNFTTEYYTLPNHFGISGRQPMRSSSPADTLHAMLNITTSETNSGAQKCEYLISLSKSRLWAHPKQRHSSQILDNRPWDACS